MIKLITSNYPQIIGAVLQIIAAVLLVRAFFSIMRGGYRKQACSILLYLVMTAESQFGGGTGKLKFSAVSAWLYEKLPAGFKWFFSSKEIEMMIEKAVATMKKWLEENKAVAEVVEGSKLTNI